MASAMVSRVLKNYLSKVAGLGSHCYRALQFHGSPLNLKNCCQQATHQYYTRLARTQDHEAIMNVMCDTYLKCEPSIVNIGLSGMELPTLNLMIRKGMKEGMTIVAVRGDDEAVIGAAVNTGSCPWNPDHLLRFAKCCQCGPIQDLLTFYAYVTATPQLWQKYCILKIFECTYVTVANEYQGNGIAKRLIQDSWYLARDCGYRYTAKVADGFRWECVWSLPFDEYKCNGEVIFKHIQEPHGRVDVYVDQTLPGHTNELLILTSSVALIAELPLTPSSRHVE
ncbi:arylalkylamine N-acetyltransferase 1-like [Neodiprion fabricii]|uniref:arylalkylamine N-acetyltransferase 1-like n=1 Tax=Neodiprion fabricii TaxID=2872261 RepID=UPI001ED94060|nr:arylalkylamine N-acetyltransferase 1-like [Neodiprion fabricii]